MSPSGLTVSMAMKSCALGGLTFGHELGHNFGCHHDPASDTNTYFSYGHGHLIEQGVASMGYRTVLAYSAPNHQTRVNYYSNPSVNLSETQTATGGAGLSNNARVITENRFAFASLGDESAAEMCCPLSWFSFEGNCYKVFEEAKTWQDADEYCLSEKVEIFYVLQIYISIDQADLASIHSEEENEFVISLSSGRYAWLGGKRSCPGCDFEWCDWTPFDFTSWRSGQPNNWVKCLAV